MAWVDIIDANKPGAATELLEAIQASNRAKVAALAEDNWMFEKEDSLRD